MKHLVVTVVVQLSVSVAFGLRDPYSLIEAESMDINKGTKTSSTSTASSSQCLAYIDNGDHVGFKQLNFSAEAVAVQLRVACQHDYDTRRQVSLRLDSPTSTPFVTYIVDHSGAWLKWLTATVFIPIDQRPRGVHDLYFTFHQSIVKSGVVDLDWFRFVSLDSLLPPNYTECECPGKDIACPTVETVTSSSEQHGSTIDHKHSVSIDSYNESTECNRHIDIHIY